MKVVEAGVYFLYDKDELVYIGTSENILSRIGQHIAQKVKIFDRFEVFPTGGKFDRYKLESFLIQLFKPKYNVAPGKIFDFRTMDADCFPNQTIEEAIRKYEEYLGDPFVNEIAEEMGTYASALLRGLVELGAPVYKMKGVYCGAWRLDKKWYEENAEKLWDYVL